MERFYGQIIEMINDGLSVQDKNGIITYVNKRVCETIDCSGEELIGQPVESLILDSEMDLYRAQVAERKKGVDSTYELSFSKKNGDIVHTIISARPLLGENGEYIGSFAVLTDITERKRIEEARKETELRLRATIESLPFDFFAIDGNGRYILQNSACRKHWGDLIGKRPEDVAENDDVLSIWLDNNRRAFSGETVTGEVEYTINGEKGHYYNIIAPIRDKGAMRGILGINIDITERKQAEDALRESEEKFRQLAEQSPNMIFISRNERVIYANAKSDELLGYSPEELCSPDFDFFELILPESKELATNSLASHMEGKEVPPNEYTLLRKDGKKIETVISTKLIRYGGEPAVLGTVIDVTEQKRADKALRLERDKARNYIDIAGVIIIALNADGEISLINRKGLEILGCEEENIVGRNWFDDFIPESVRGRVLDGFNQLMAGNIELAEYFENEVLTRTGETRIVAWHNTLLKNEAGDIVGTLSSGEDITDRRRADEALRESEERYRRLVETSPDAITLTDLEGNLIMTNQRAAELHGCDSIDELLDKNAFEIIAPHDRKRAEENARKTLETGSVRNIEYDMLRKDGTQFSGEISASLILGAENEPTAFIGVVRDITERKLAEERLKETSEELQIEREALQEKNIALREVMSQIEQEKETIKQQIVENVERVILPSLQRLKDNCESRQKAHVEHIESSLKIITSPFVDILRSSYSSLTPREIEICKMIKNGLLSKEISEILNVSILTVHKHREMIRKKLGIRNRRVNLNSYLQSIELRISNT